jgi:hypothetical protein
MSLNSCNVPKTPESRTPYVLLLLVCVAGIAAAWRLLSGFRWGVELALTVMGHSHRVRGPSIPQATPSLNLMPKPKPETWT